MPMPQATAPGFSPLSPFRVRPPALWEPLASVICSQSRSLGEKLRFPATSPTAGTIAQGPHVLLDSGLFMKRHEDV